MTPEQLEALQAIFNELQSARETIYGEWGFGVRASERKVREEIERARLEALGISFAPSPTYEDLEEEAREDERFGWTD